MPAPSARGGTRFPFVPPPAGEAGKSQSPQTKQLYVERFCNPRAAGRETHCGAREEEPQKQRSGVGSRCPRVGEAWGVVVGGGSCYFPAL